MAKKKDFNEVMFDELYVGTPTPAIRKQEEPVKEDKPEIKPPGANESPSVEEPAQRGGAKKTEKEPYKMLTTKVRTSVNDMLNQHSFFEKREKKDIIEEALLDYFTKHKGKIPNY